MYTESSVCIEEYHSGPVNAVASYVDHFSLCERESDAGIMLINPVFIARNFPILLQR